MKKNSEERINQVYSGIESLYVLAKSGKLSHAIVFECTDEEKAYTIALEVAKITLCLSKDSPCNKCLNCLKLIRQSHPDVKTVSVASNTKSVKIEDIRFIREDAYIASNEGSYKFYIIKNADNMTFQAQNALIKILEEPPKNVIFILICKSSSSLLDTVISRSQIFYIQNTLNGYLADTEDLSKKIVLSSLNQNKYEIIKYISTVPNDRKLLKELMECIIDNYLRIYFTEKRIKTEYDSVIKKIENIKDLIGLVDKNINFNLLTCYLCVCL